MRLIERITLVRDDITRQDVDAIVNAANNSLLGGGGVDGASHRAAGPELLAECRTLGGCDTGWAKATGGYNLKARHVIHTVGPVYKRSADPAGLLASCYRSVMGIARELGLSSLAFPSISTGVYGYPISEACPIALKTVLDELENSALIEDVRFVLFSPGDLDVYERHLQALSDELGGGSS